MHDHAEATDQIVLTMDRMTARDLYDSLHAVGEHWAAGAEIPYPSPAVIRNLTAVFENLGHRLDIPTMAESMQREHDRRSERGSGQM